MNVEYTIIFCTGRFEPMNEAASKENWLIVDKKAYP